MERISEHISYAEATKSQEAIRKGLVNAPNSTQLEAMKYIAENIFEPLRRYHGKPIGISSFFRSKVVNKAIGGSDTSQHCKGEAIDIDADIFDNGITNKQIFEWILANCTFDQIIWEFGTDENPDWVHVSLKKQGNRRQVLRAKRVNGKTFYEKII